MTAYDVGDSAVLDLTVEVSDPDDPDAPKVLTDPTTVDLLLLDPASGETTTLVPVRMSQGKYKVSYIPTHSGVWRYRWVTTGPGAGAQDGSFVVRPTFSWLPTASDVRSEMSGRKAALDRLSDDAIDEEIARRSANLQAELPADLSPRLQPVARDFLLFSVASILEDRLFPEQAGQAGSNAERLDKRAGAELVRLRGQLGETADSGATGFWAGSISLRGGCW